MRHKRYIHQGRAYLMDIIVDVLDYSKRLLFLEFGLVKEISEFFSGQLGSLDRNVILLYCLPST
jgi:hypothetical protein